MIYAPDSRLEARRHWNHHQGIFCNVYSEACYGRPSYYMKLINIHYIEVSISAWVSHAMPLKNNPGCLYIVTIYMIYINNMTYFSCNAS